MECRVGQLLCGGILGSGKKMYRLVGLFPEHDEAYVSEIIVEPKKKPRSTPPKTVRLTLLREQLYREVRVLDESVRYPWMLWPEDKLNAELPSATRVRDEAIKGLCGLYNPVEYKKSGLLLLTREALQVGTRGTLFKACAERTGMKIRQIYKQVDRLLTYGPIENALLSHKKLSGAEGPRRLGGRRTGRPNAYAKEEPDHLFAGQVLTKYHIRKFRRALTEYFVGQNMSLSAAYRRMRQDLYVQTMPKQGGGYASYAVHPGKIPSFAQFYDYYCYCRSEGEFVTDKAGDEEYQKNRKPFVQSSRDISDGPLDIFDIDGTGGKIELVATYHPDMLIGRPLIILAVDRGSDAIVGAHVTTFGESAESYKKCLYIAFTEKDSLLKKLGLPLHYWTEFGQCNSIFVDQGAGKSREIEDALVGRLNRGRYIAPAGNPRAKALVEGLNDKLHDWMSNVEGAYDRMRDGERKMKRRASAKNRASRTRREYWIKLIEFIYEHNTTTNVSHLLTPDMRAEKVKGFPRDIFGWAKKKRRGAERQEHSATDLARLLLEHVPRTVQEDGVHFNKRKFASPEILALREDHMSRHAHWAKMPPLKITVYPNPHDPDVLYWEPEPGNLKELTATTDSQHRTRNMSYDDWLDCLRADQKTSIDARNKVHGKTFLSRDQVNVLVGIARNRTDSQVRMQEIRTNRALERMFENAETDAAHREVLFPNRDGYELVPSQLESAAVSNQAETATVADLSSQDNRARTGEPAEPHDEFGEAYGQIFGE